MTQENQLERASRFYVRAIGEGDPEGAVAAYVGDDYIQHNPHVATGAQPFIDHFAGFCERNPSRDVRVHRGFSVGRYTFIHAFQDLGDAGLWATMDLFRFDAGGRILEHWDNLARAEHADVMAGPLTDPAGDTDASRAALRRFTDGARRGTASSPEATDALGLDVGAWLSEPRQLRCHALLASGNMAAAVLEDEREDGPHAVWLACCVGDGDIERLWIIDEAVQPPEHQLHDNGKFGFPSALAPA